MNEESHGAITDVRASILRDTRDVGRGESNRAEFVVTNARRASWAEESIDRYARLTWKTRFGELAVDDRETCLGDLLADLVHLCRRDGLDFERSLRLARGNAAEEERFGWEEPTA